MRKKLKINYLFISESLFFDFLKTYGTFKFDTETLSVLSRNKSLTRTENSAIYLENPIDQDLNICKNVSQREIEIFQEQCLKDADTLQNLIEKGGDLWTMFPALEEATNSEVEHNYNEERL